MVSGSAPLLGSFTAAPLTESFTLKLVMAIGRAQISAGTDDTY